MVFLSLLLVPLLIAIGAFIFTNGTITLKEFGVHVAIQVVVALASVGVIYYANTSDRGVLNGRVTSKARERVSCEHSYSCNCRQVCHGSGKDQTCSTVCDTCYEHSYDISWAVYTSLNSRHTIDRIDRQGLGQPPRWTAVKLKEPVAETYGYTNYVKAAPGSLFRHQGLLEQYQAKIPGYPLAVYDYWHINRFVGVDAGIADEALWNMDLQELNAVVGPQKEANVVVVLTRGLERDFYYALEQAWIGAKKNDIVLVIGMDDNRGIQWAEVMAWTDAEIFKVKLRDDVLALGTVDRALVLGTIERNVRDFYVRKPMKDFEYLAASVTPTPGEYAFALIVGILVSIGVAVWLHKEDVFREEQYRFSRYFR